MTMQYAQFDTDLATAPQLILTFVSSAAVPSLPVPVIGGISWPAPLLPGLITNHPVRFQFPPKVTGDSRKGNWNQGKVRGLEPAATYESSDAREITLSWTYIVDNYTDNQIPPFGGDTASRVWTPSMIHSQLTLLRGYFAQVRGPGLNAQVGGLPIRLQLWRIGGDEQLTGRMEGITIKHGDTMVGPQGNTALAFPLRTDVTADLAIWTRGEIVGYAGVVDRLKIVQNLEGLAITETPDWY